jgi:serine/threonine protein kinase
MLMAQVHRTASAASGAGPQAHAQPRLFEEMSNPAELLESAANLETIMHACLETLMTGAGVLLGAALSLGADVGTWHRAPSPSRARLVPFPRRRRVGPYELLEKIAVGAMGEVYRARHTGSGQVRAVKLLSPRAGERQRRQFEKEVRFGEQLRYPNQVPVHDHGEALDGTLYFSMDLLDGITLEALVEREGALPPRRVIDILLQVATVLAEVHDHGFVHRDIKPSNILWCRAEDGLDCARLLDFGLVKELGEPSSTSSPEDCVVGTPLYISPEALTAPDTVDGRTDLYGLGAVAYFLLSGAPVFGGRGVVEVCAKHLLTAPKPLSETAGCTVSSELDQIVLDCLAKDPASRPATARELIGRLEHCPEVGVASGPSQDEERVRTCSGPRKDFGAVRRHVAAGARTKPSDAGWGKQDNEQLRDF